MPPRLSSNELEAANRAEATALLIRSFYRVYRPEADVDGEDLILRAPPWPTSSATACELLRTQLKGRPTVDWPRYGGKEIRMLFPNPQGALGRPWYLMPHDNFFDWVKSRHCGAPRWQDYWSYRTMPQVLAEFLEPFRVELGASPDADPAD